MGTLAQWYTALGRYDRLILRFAIGAVILWFGLNELLDPNSWVTWVPAWATFFGLSKLTIVYLNGTFEVVASVLLILGFFRTWVAGLLFLHMLLMVWDIGLTAIGVRDFGLAAALLVLSVHE